MRKVYYHAKTVHLVDDGLQNMTELTGIANKEKQGYCQIPNSGVRLD